MRYLFILLLSAISPLAHARVPRLATFGQESHVPALSKKQPKIGLFKRLLEKQVNKRIKNALGRGYGEWEKVLSILGLVCTVLGVFLLLAFLSVIAGPLLILGGLVLSIFGLVLSSGTTEKWVRALAIVGIILASALLLLLVGLLVALAVLFL